MYAHLSFFVRNPSNYYIIGISISGSQYLRARTREQGRLRDPNQDHRHELGLQPLLWSNVANIDSLLHRLRLATISWSNMESKCVGWFVLSEQSSHSTTQVERMEWLAHWILNLHRDHSAYSSSLGTGDKQGHSEQTI